jgi:hypothetical protein
MEMMALKDSTNYWTPFISGLCQPAQSTAASKGYHVVITSNICVNRTTRQLRQNKDKYAGRESKTVTDVEKADSWTFFLSPQYSSTVP